MGKTTIYIHMPWTKGEKGELEEVLSTRRYWEKKKLEYGGKGTYYKKEGSIPQAAWRWEKGNNREKNELFYQSNRQKNKKIKGEGFKTNPR